MAAEYTVPWGEFLESTEASSLDVMLEWMWVRLSQSTHDRENQMCDSHYAPKTVIKSNSKMCAGTNNTGVLSWFSYGEKHRHGNLLGGSTRHY